MRDAEARRRIREDLDTTLFVEAAAGTGKTTELVARIVSLLASGRTTLERVVAVTFTEKAAGEMKLRLRAEIERARAGLRPATPDPARLDAALEKLEEANIGTIHAFCADLLRTRPVEASVDPLFEVAPEDEQQRLLDGAFDAWFQHTLADPTEGIRRMLRRRPRGPTARSPRQQLRAAMGALVEHRDFEAAWRRDPFSREVEIDAVVERLAGIGALAARARRGEDWLARNLSEVARFVDELRLRESVRGRDHDGLEAELRGLAGQRSWRWRGSGAYGKDLDRADVLIRRDEAKAALDRLVERCDADLAPLLREELLPVLAEYEKQKRRAGRLDFLDLLLRARDLVREDSAVRGVLQARFSHFFVDEFQDTDPLQAEILLLLAADDPAQTDWTEVTPVPGKLFLVGDPKQSIYRFRRADVALYERVRNRLRERGAALLHLTTSFRSVPSLQQTVNAAFEPVMRGSEESNQTGYVPLEPSRPEAEGRPSLVALPVPRPWRDFGDRARIFNYRIDESLPDAVGAFVSWLVHESGWTVTERETPAVQVPIQARHVCLLFRRFKRFRDDVTRPYVRALEVRRVPHVLVGGRSFHDREEVLALRNALVAIEWPDDELRVFATLRGPLFALSDDALLAFRHRVGSLHPLRRLEEAVLEPPERAVAEALGVLARLHRHRNHRPIAETVSQLLDAVRAHAGIAIWPTGEQALANCLRVIDLARRFERRGAPSFRAFADRLEADAERGEAEEAPVVEEGTEGVRIMTVHKAKGLEFPVVILADPTCAATREPPTRHVDPERRLWAEALCGCAPAELLERHDDEAGKDREEAMRLTYVAATRARDVLVVPVCGDDPLEGWLDILNPAVYPEPKARRRPGAAPGCPPFGADSVVDRPESSRRGSEGAVAPGLHRASVGGGPVTWWDPHILDLDRDEQVGLRQQRILEVDAEGTVAEESARAHERWRTDLDEALARGRTPWLQVETVTVLASELLARGEPAHPPEPVSVLDVPLERAGRPRGRRFGTLVHATLAAVDLDAEAAAVRATATQQGRLMAATAPEVEAAATAVEAALVHPLLRAAARAASQDGLRRETPVLLRQEDGGLAEGVVDLAFREDVAGWPSWVVVDFKTDQELEPRRAVYEAQVRLYARAVAAATGEPARAVLLTV
ncbi:MAG: UvrD-helicase domain-containing protein [Myxococcota bacterium]